MVRKAVLFLVAVLLVLVSITLAGESQSHGFLWWESREPIYIFGDEDFTYENGVITGSGTVDDPFVIQGWPIDNAQADYGIYVDHTTRHFVIRNCVVERARVAGIYLNTVANGRIEDCELSNSDTGIYLLNSRDNTLVGNLITENLYGVVMAAGSRNNTITSNSFVDNGVNGLDHERRNHWHAETIGNYWSDYKRGDLNGDGIGDYPYTPVGDCYPLISSPVNWIFARPFANLCDGKIRMVDGVMMVTSTTPIRLDVSDYCGSGVGEIYFSINEGQYRFYSGPFTLTGPEGPVTISYYGVDNVGNVSEKRTVSFLVSNVPMWTSVKLVGPQYESGTRVWLTSETLVYLCPVGETESRQVWTCYRIDDGSWIRYSAPFTIPGPDGPHTIRYYSEDALGNRTSIHSITVFKDDTPPSTGDEPQVEPCSDPLESETGAQTSSQGTSN